MNKALLFFSLLLLAPAMTAQERFPDGKKISAWFGEAEKVALSALGRQYVLTDYGVEADKAAVQTEAIQRVIDLAAEKGGVVVVPEGVFLSGALHFRKAPICGWKEP